MKGTAKPGALGATPMRGLFAPLHRLYHWVLGLAESPYGEWALFWIALSEASFFPIPPDVLLIALAIGAPARALRLSALCTAGSVLGAALGYLIGWQFYQHVGRPILEWYDALQRYQEVKLLYEEWDAVAVFIAGFTPIPFKVFTIAAGAFQIHFLTFLLAALASRASRFFLVGLLIRSFGAPIRDFIERYFNLLTVLFTLLLLGGFLVLKYAM